MDKIYRKRDNIKEVDTFKLLQGSAEDISRKIKFIETSLKDKGFKEITFTPATGDTFNGYKYIAQGKSLETDEELKQREGRKEDRYRRYLELKTEFEEKV